MKHSRLNTLLLVLWVAGTLAAFKSASMLQTARDDLRLVRQLAGSLRIRDPDEICFVRFKGIEQGEFAWRFYVPRGVRAAPWDSSAEEVQHFIARARFAYSDSGSFVVHTRFRDQWQSKELGSPALSQFVREHHSELVIEQSGRRHQQNVAPGIPHSLLHISVPEHLISEARERLSETEASRVLPVIFEWRLGR